MYTNYFLKLSYVSVLTLVTVGCTTQLTGTKLSTDQKTATGQVYFLPRVDFSVVLERELKSSTAAFENDAVAAALWLYEVAPKIDQQRDEARTKQAYLKIKNDPVLKQADVLEYFNANLAVGKGLLPKDISAITYENAVIFLKNLPDAQKIKLTGELNEIFANQEKLRNFSKSNLPLLENAKIKLDFEVEMRAKVTPQVFQDSGQVYTLKYSDMESFTKGTNYSVEKYPNGTLKGINVTIDDQSGTIIQNSVQALAKLAAASNGFPLTLAGPKANAVNDEITSFEEWKKSYLESQNLCNDTTKLLLIKRAALSKVTEAYAKQALADERTLGKLQDAVDSATNKQEDITKKIADLADGDVKKSALKIELKNAEAVLKSAKSELAKAQKGTDLNAKANNKAVESMGAIRKALTVTAVSQFEPDHPALDSTGQASAYQKKLPGMDAASHSWLEKTKLSKYCEKKEDCEDSWPKAIAKLISAEVALYPNFSGVYKKDKQPKGESVVYREPVKSLLMVCQGTPCLSQSDHKPNVTNEAIVYSSIVDVPQLGILAELPLKNEQFQNNNLTALFSETGSLSKLTYTSNAVGVKFSETLSSSADSLLKYKEAKRGEEKSKTEGLVAETDAKAKLVESQLKLEQAQANLKKFREEQK